MHNKNDLQPTENSLSYEQKILLEKIIQASFSSRNLKNRLVQFMCQSKEEVCSFLLNIINDVSIEPKTRVEAGRLISKIGDPRHDVLSCEHILFCHIPEGNFIFGDTPTNECGYKKDIFLPEFWISKYPITNSQFNQFTKDHPYSNSIYWKEAAENQLWSHKGFKEPWEKDYRFDPINLGEPFNLPNHPVVGISWHEAIAFTRWLSEKFQIKNQIIPNYMVGKQNKNITPLIALPSEEQWEKAARGVNGQKYPWGEFPNSNAANYLSTNINTTSAVGCFPSGVSPFGVMDSIGNVWEYTSNPNVLRGGSFNSIQEFIHCTFSGRLNPYRRYGQIGFRIALQFIS